MQKSNDIGISQQPDWPRIARLFRMRLRCAMRKTRWTKSP